jgi:hypothetical protein
MSQESLIRLIADRFVEWQTPYGRPDPVRCPFVTQGYLVLSTHFHSPSFMALGLYRAFEATGDPSYRAAADRYVAFYFACLRNPPDKPDAYASHWIRFMEEKYGPDPHRAAWAVNILTWPFMYGMALAAYRHFKDHHPDEVAMDSKAAALFDWLRHYRWDEGSYFRNGYGSPAHGVLDAGNSDDNCHIGRGLIGYYAVSCRPEVLAEAEGLADYYLTECVPGTYQGCWSSALGSWVVAPTVVDGIEHFRGLKSCEMAWSFSSVGAIDYLTQLAAATADESLRSRIAEKCAASMKWQFDACQFDDGAVGMHGRDDRWLGTTAGAILSFLRVRDAGFLSEADLAAYRLQALAARTWLLAHLTPEAVESGGYFRVTGQSEPRPPENLAWLLGWTLEALTRMEEI